MRQAGSIGWPKGLHRGRNRSAGKYAYRATFGHIGQRVLSRCQISRNSLFRFIKADRKDHLVDLFSPSKHAMRQDAKIAPRLAQDMAQHQTIQNSVRMVRDRNKRA